MFVLAGGLQHARPMWNRMLRLQTPLEFLRICLLQRDTSSRCQCACSFSHPLAEGSRVAASRYATRLHQCRMGTWKRSRRLLSHLLWWAAPTVWIGPIMEWIPKPLRSLGQIMQLWLRPYCRICTSAAPEMVDQGALTENLVEQWERRRLQLQIASVYWFCGIEKSQILDILRNASASAPLSLEETLGFKCLVRCFSVAEGLHPSELIPVMGALEAAWGAGSLPRVLGVLSHSLLREMNSGGGRQRTQLPYKCKVHFITEIRRRMPPPLPTAPVGTDNMNDGDNADVDDIPPPLGTFANPLPSSAALDTTPLGPSSSIVQPAVFPRGISRAPPPSSAPTLPPATTSRSPLLEATAPPFPPPPPVQEDAVMYYTRLLRQLERTITLMEALGQPVPDWAFSHLLILQSKGGIPSARPSAVATGPGEARPATGSVEPRPTSAPVDWDDI